MLTSRPISTHTPPTEPMSGLNGTAIAVLNQRPGYLSGYVYTYLEELNMLWP